jgi:copper(I)-binding protein
MSPAALAAAKTTTRAALVAVIALTLAACSSGGTTDNANSLKITDAWVKSADSGMTAAFGEIKNTTNHQITVVSGTSPATSQIQLHEVVGDVMRPVAGGFVIPAGGTFTLQPGGYHIMFMDVPKPIVAGDSVSITLKLDDGSEFTFSAVAKDFSGANEKYNGGMNMSPSPSAGMNMGSDPSMSPSASMGG